MNQDPDGDHSDLVQFTSSRSVARWPQMVPTAFRQRWRTGRGFSFDWALPAERDAIPVEIVLRDNAAVLEVLGGAIEVEDGLERLWCRAGSAVAVSLDRFLVTLSSMDYTDVFLRVHIVGTIPFRDLILSNPAYATVLKRFEGVLPGIFSLAGTPLQEAKPRTDPGETMVGRYSQMPAFFRFLASFPKAIHRPERRATRGPTARASAVPGGSNPNRNGP